MIRIGFDQDFFYKQSTLDHSYDKSPTYNCNKLQG